MERSLLLLCASLGAAAAFAPTATLFHRARNSAAISRRGSRALSMSLSKVTDITKGEVHGENGAYVAGFWVPYDDCDEHFNIKGGSNEKVHAEPCPRSRTRHSAAKPDGSYDVAIIGAGCIGSAIARELAKTDASVVVIEAADDVSQGATKGNSGIVHAGFDDKPGSVRAKFCWKGNQMFPELDNDLHFGYQLTGSLVVARSAEDEKHLHELIERGKSNGVKNLRIVREKELKQIEPHIHPDATAALFSPDAGTLIPYEYTIALAENAADNGVEFRIRREVTDICKDEAGLFEIDVNHWEPEDFVDQQNPLKKIAGKIAGGARSLGNYFGGPGENGPWDKFPALVRGRQHVDVEDMKLGGSGSKKAMGGVSVGKEKVRAKYIVNAAGGFSDKISAMIGDDSFKVKPRLGEYVLLRKNQGHLCNHILFPCPGPYGKGILVQKTLWGNLILGPTARDQHEWPDGKTDPDSKEDILGKILAACRGLVPDFDTNESIHSFSGARSKTDVGDWIIQASTKDKHFIQAAGIDSPGIAASPAIAVEVVDLLNKAGLCAAPSATFNPKRAPVIRPKRGEEGLVFTPDDKEMVNAAGAAPEANVVCKCEKVTEAEVVDAMHRSLPIDSTQGIRKRTRAGMGGCQGKPWNYGCECRVAQIIARESGEQAKVVGRRPWSATSLFPRRWLTDSDRDVLKKVSKAPDAAPAVASEVVAFERQNTQTVTRK
jgi:glycerol-3-phosphate dehydrogenase